MFLGVQKFQVHHKVNKHSRIRYPFPSFGPTPKVLEFVVIVEISPLCYQEKNEGAILKGTLNHHQIRNLLDNYCSYLLSWQVQYCHAVQLFYFEDSIFKKVKYFGIC